MQIKQKLCLIGAAIALFNLPIMAQADENVLAPQSLTTINSTKFYSTVKITSGHMHLCSSVKADGITPPDGKPHQVSWDSVKALCLTSGDVCVADVYPTNNCEKGGSPIGSATLHLSSGVVDSIQMYDTQYKIVSPGNAAVTISGGPK